MRVCVIPDEPIQAYVDRGFSEEMLWRYFNPDDFFDEVYIASWQEARDWSCGNLRIVALPLDKKSVRRIQRNLRRLNRSKALPEPFMGEIFHRFQEGIVSTFRSIDADVIRAYNGHWAAELGVELRQKLRAPFICSVLDGSHIVPPALALADTVICPDESVRDSLRKKGVSDQKIHCIPGCVNIETFQVKEGTTESMLALYQFLVPEKGFYSDKVSIVLPTYNGAKYIRKSIDSCLNQTHKNIELVIVNDCSTDETPDIVKSYNDPRIKYVEHEVNKKLPTALNTGFAHASGEYLTWTSDDNLYAPEAIETLLRFLHSYPDIYFVYADYYQINENDETVSTNEVKPADMLIHSNCIGPSFLYKRDVYEKTGDFNPDVTLAEDYEYWLRVWKNFKMQRLRKALYYYRSHRGSLTGKYGSRRVLRIANEVRENLLLTEFDLNCKPRKIRGRSYMSTAFDEYKHGNLTELKRNIILGILYDRSWLRNTSVISIMIELLLGKRAANQLRKARRWAFGSSSQVRQWR